MKNTVQKASDIIATAIGKVPRETAGYPTSPNYPIYLTENSASPDELKAEREFVFRNPPLVSIFMMGGGKSDSDVSASVLSLFSQTYEHFELILGVDASCGGYGRFSGLEAVKTVIGSSPEKLCSSAEALAKGDYIMLLYAGDRAAPDMLFRMVRELVKHPGTDLIYADNDYHDELERRSSPVFKPVFSPCTGYAFDYIRRPLLVSRRLHEKAGGFGIVSKYGCRQYTINCIRYSSSALNIPRMLLSVREESQTPDSAVYSIENGIDAFPGLFLGSQMLCSSSIKKSSVSIIIGDAADAGTLRRCLETIESEATYFNYKIIISICSDCEKKLGAYIDALKRNKAASVVCSAPGTTLPALLNAGAARSFSEYLIFMSSEVEILTPDFIERLLDPLFLKDVSVCGGKLLSPDGLLLHTGSVIGLNGMIGSPYSGTNDDMSDMQKCFFTALQRNVSAVSGRFMAVSAEDFAAAGMFDETFTDVVWDAEFCLRAMKRGMQTVFTPFAAAYYYGAPDDYENAPEKNMERCRDAFREFILKGDPYYSPNLDRRYSVPQLLIRPEI